MILDRAIQPAVSSIRKIDISTIEKNIMSNGVPLYTLNVGSEEVVRIDIVINSGKWNASRPLEAEFTNLLLKEGAGELTSSQIAEKLDFYGAWLQTSITQQASYITLYVLNKFFDQMLFLLETVLKEPKFPQQEFDVIIQNRKQEFLINKNKVNFLAGRAFLQALFGASHPYGRVSSESDFDTLTVDILKSFYTNNYASENMLVGLFGKINSSMLQQVETVFGASTWGNGQPKTKKEPTIESAQNKKIVVVKQDALQSAIYIGKESIVRSHPDFHPLFVLNAVLGGYFGSRLMSNIREDKGYTYGIYSSLSAFRNAGYMNISTQVGKEYVANTIQEIYKEMDRLCQEKIPEKELQLVRNYLLGEVARKFDNSFALADIHLSLLEFDLGKSFYEQRIETIKSVTAEQLQELAQKYYVKDSFYEVVAG